MIKRMIEVIFEGFERLGNFLREDLEFEYKSSGNRFYIKCELWMAVLFIIFLIGFSILIIINK